jgi:hypothetical protein
MINDKGIDRGLLVSNEEAEGDGRPCEAQEEQDLILPTKVGKVTLCALGRDAEGKKLPKRSFVIVNWKAK